MNAETLPAAANADWPLLRIALPSPIDDEAVAALTAEAIASAGALGGAIEGDTLAIYLPRQTDLQSEPIARLRRWLAAEAEALGWPASIPEPEAIADAPWATAWKVGFQTLPIGRRLLIRPDWERGTPTLPEFSGRETIWLRPGQGFGTGHHETTRLALTALEDTLQIGDRVLDFGTGSGVLSIAAVRLGAASAVGIDLDPQALLNARENLEINELESLVEFRETGTPPAGENGAPGDFSLVVCNMLPQEALHLLPSLAKCLNQSNPRLIYTGFLADQIDEVRKALLSAGLKLQRECKDGEWCGVAAIPG